MLHRKLIPLLCAGLLVAAGGTYAPEAPVADAAMRGDAEQVRRLVTQGADVNAAQGDGMTALHWAADHGDAGMVEFLLQQGADVGAATRLAQYTPLHLAARRGAGQAVEALLRHGADATAVTSTGDVTALHFAAAGEDATAVRALLRAGADPNAVEREWGRTPLMFAAARNGADAIRTLLEAGADPGATAWILDLRERGRFDQADERGGSANTVIEGRRTTLDEPAQSVDGAALPKPGRIDPVPDSMLLRPLSEADLVGAYGGLTPLLLAAREGAVDAATALLDGGADIDQTSAADGSSPLLMAALNGHFDLAVELLRRGADPRIASNAGATPLYAAINTQWIPNSRHPQPADYMQQETSYLELAEVLLKAGADPNARLRHQLWYTEYSREFLGVDRMGATPFWRAAHATDVAAMRLLVSYGADPSIPTRKPGERRAQTYSEVLEDDPSGLPPVPPGGPGVYAIHAASGVGYGEGFAGNVHRHVPDGWLPALRYLVEDLGADVNARDYNGYTPLHHAAARGDNAMILYLVEHGADPKVVARTGQTTVDMANGPVQRISPFPETIELLESMGAINNHNCVSC
jgi:ankyrin repeat protein